MSQQQTSAYSGAAVGFTVFASVMMVMMGLFQAFVGVVALVNDEFYVVGSQWVFQFDVTTWGWVHLTIGIVVLLAGMALFSGAVWARTVGVLLAVVSAFASFAWIPWYPVWGVVMIAISFFVIWALTAHGRDITRA